MYIIDKNKDYYDYLSNIYGVDKEITYDRRGSEIISLERFLEISISDTYSRPESSLLLLEIGYKQYLIKFSDIKYRKDITNTYHTEAYMADLSILNIFENNKHYFDSEISIMPTETTFDYKRQYWNKKKIKLPPIITDIAFYRTKVINNPILKDTGITSLIPAFDIYKEVSTYISSKHNDKNIDIINTDKDKIVNHGFDNKSSFRNPIKL